MNKKRRKPRKQKVWEIPKLKIGETERDEIYNHFLQIWKNKYNNDPLRPKILLGSSVKDLGPGDVINIPKLPSPPKEVRISKEDMPRVDLPNAGKSKVGPSFSLFATGFIQVYFVSVNTYFLANEMYLGVLVAAFMISLIWSFNVKKVAFGSGIDRVVYSIGATCGSLIGLWSSAFMMDFIKVI